MEIILFAIALLIFCIYMWINHINRLYDDSDKHNHVKYLLIYYTGRVIKPILKITELLFIKLKWNEGICKKCKSNRYELTDFDSDRLKPYYYKCKKCSHLLKTHNAYDELQDSEAKSKIRDYKLKKMGLD